MQPCRKHASAVTASVTEAAGLLFP